jgi:hypothetical protein
MDNSVSQKAEQVTERTVHENAGEKLDCQKVSRSSDVTSSVMITDENLHRVKNNIF